jgi:hypothetical protein
MAKDGGKLLIKYRDPVAASFSSKDVVMNVQTGTLFYKRNRKLYALRGTPDNFDLVVFPGQSTNQQILFNDSSQTDGSPIMEGSDQFRFKAASATCGCASYFTVGAETLTTFSGSVRIGEHLPGTCNLLDGYVNPALMVYGNLSTTASIGTGHPGHITASGNVWSYGNVIADLDLFGTNAYIDDSLIHTGNTGTKLTFTTDKINLYAGSNNIATVSSSQFVVNAPYDLYIPGTDQVTGPLTSSGTNVLVIDNITGQVYKTGSYQGATFKSTGIRVGDSEITGALGILGNLSINGYITASKARFTNLSAYPNTVSTFDVLTINNGNVYTTSSAAFNHYNYSWVADEGSVVVSNAQIINFVGNAVTATGGGGTATVTINAPTESLWYDGKYINGSYNANWPYISSSDNVLIDQKLGIGTAWYGNYSILQHDIHLTASNSDELSVGYTGVKGHTWSTGTTLGGSNIFSISDIGDSIGGQASGNRVISIYGTGSNLPGNYNLQAPEAIRIEAGLKSGGQSPNPTFIGATNTAIPAVMIHPTLESSSLAKFHINTNNEDEGKLYNGLLVGPSYNPTNSTVRTGSGLFIHMGGNYDNNTIDSPRILSKTEAGSSWAATTGLVIQSDTDRNNTYPGSYPGGTARSATMEFRVRDIAGKAYGVTAAGGGNGGQANLSTVSEVFGTGTDWINGQSPSSVNSNILYSFYNDQKSLLSIEASGRVGIGDFSYNVNPSSLLHIAAKSGSNADIGLHTFDKNSKSIPLLKFELGTGSATTLNPNNHNTSQYRGEMYLLSPTQSNNTTYYNLQHSSSLTIESKGTREGLINQQHPFDVEGGAAGTFKGANNIQLVVGADNSPYVNLGGSGLSTAKLSGNNGYAGLTVEGISDFRRMGEVGIGVLHPLSSLHVTRSVQADNFRTTTPTDILISGSLRPLYNSTEITGSGTTFTTDFKVGNAIKVKGKSIIASIGIPYTASINVTSASAYNWYHDPNTELIIGDTILISSGSLSSKTGSYHTVTNLALTGTTSSIHFSPAYTGTTTSSVNLIHRVNPHFYQINTINTIHNDTHMSVDKTWEGDSTYTATGYKEEILFQVKTADYRPVFSIASDGTVTNGGIVGTFKSTGLRQGHAQIEGDLTIRPQDILPAANLNIISKDTGSAAHSILTLKQYDQGANTTGSKLMYNAGDNEFQIYGNKGIDKHLTIHHDSGLVTVKENLIVENNITASNNISASGLLYASSSQGNYSNVVVQDTASGRFYTTSSAALTTATVDTFKQTGVRTGDSILSGSLIIRPLPPHSGHQTASLKIWGHGQGVAEIHLSQDGDGTPGHILRFNGISNDFEINKEDGTTQLAIDPSGTVRIPGIISSSGKVYHGGLTFGTAGSLVTMDPTTGEFKRQAIKGAIAIGIPGLLSSSFQIESDISGAFTSTSASIAANIATNVTNIATNTGNISTLNSAGLLSSSFQIESDISGAFNGVTGSFLLNTTDTLTGDLTVTGTITAQEFHTEFVSASIIFESGSTQFGNSSDDIHTFSGSIHVKDEGHITASGNISASGNITSSGLFADGPISASGTLHAGLTAGLTNYAVFYNTNTGELLHEVAPSSFTPGGISGSWQGYITGSGIVSSSTQIDTFKSTGIRTGDGFIDGDITGSSKLLIQKSSGQGTPSAGTSDIAIFQNNDNSQDASIAIIAADTHRSQLHFGKHDGIDIGSIKYFHDGHSTSPDQFKFKVNGQNVVTFNNVSSKGSIGVGSDFTPTDYFHAQGVLSGGGLTISSSNGGTILLKAANTRTILDRTATDKKLNIEFNTAGTTNWTLGNISESNDNFYIYSGDGQTDKHISLTSDSTTFHTNVTASGNISASGTLSAGLTSAQPANIAYYDTVTGLFTYGLATGASGFTAIGISGSWQSQYFNTLTTAGISGSFTLTSASIATNIATNVTNIATNTSNISTLNSAGLLSSSFQIASDISGSWDSEYFTTLTAAGISGSWLSQPFANLNATSISGSWLSQPFANLSAAGISGSFLLNTTDTLTGDLFVTNDIKASGDISASGKLYAGLSAATPPDSVFYNTTTGELSYGTAASSFTATGISGSWLSQGFISGAQVLENLNPNTLSSSFQIESDISGAFTLTSASIATNIATNTNAISTLNSSGLLSSSFQIESDISGSWQGQNFISSSQTFLTTGQRNGDSAITGSLDVTNNITASGNISASGAITSSGLFLPQLGTIEWLSSAGQSQTIKGTDHYIQIDGDNRVIMTADNDVTINSPETNISGDVSASGLLYASSSQGNYSNIVVQDTASGRFYTTASSAIGGGDTFLLTGQRDGNSGITGSLNVTGTLTAGSITSNFTVYTNHLAAYGNLNSSGNTLLHDLEVGGEAKFSGLYVHVDGNLSSSGNITSSGNISASGYLNAKLDPDTTATYKTVMYDTTTGRLSTTGSYGGGGGGSTFTATGISGSWLSQPFANLNATSISGSWLSQPFANLSAAGISGSFLLNTTDTLTGTLTIQAPTTDSTLLLSSVGNSNDSSVQLRQSNNTGFDVKYDGGVDKFQIKNNSNNLPFQIEHVTPTNTLYLSGSGNVGIGTSSPTEKLTVVGNISASGKLYSGLTAGTPSDIVFYDSSTGELQYGANNTPYTLDVAADGGAAQSITDAETLTIEGTAPISTLMGTNKVTISHDNIGAGAGTYGSTASGTKIHNIVIDAQGHVTSVTTGTTGDISGVGTTAASGLEGGVTTGQANLSIKWSGNNNYINDTPNGALATFADGDRFAVVDVGQNPDLVKYMTGTVLKDWIQVFTGTMSSFILAGDTGADQTITNGNTISILGGTGLTTATSATDDLTVNLDLANLTGMPDQSGTDQMVIIDNIDVNGGPANVSKRQQINNYNLSNFNNDIVGSGNFITLIGGNINFTPTGVACGVHYNNTSSDFTSPTPNFTYNASSITGAAGLELRVPGDVIAFFSSDKRLKDNIKPISNPIKKILQIGGYSFDWNEKQNTYSGHDIGVIAQEIEKVLPEVVETRENGYKAVKYEKIVPLLIEGIKDQQKQIDELKELVAKLINK